MAPGAARFRRGSARPSDPRHASICKHLCVVSPWARFPAIPVCTRGANIWVQPEGYRYGDPAGLGLMCVCGEGSFRVALPTRRQRRRPLGPWRCTHRENIIRSSESNHVPIKVPLQRPLARVVGTCSHRFQMFAPPRIVQALFTPRPSISRDKAWATRHGTHCMIARRGKCTG